MKQVNFSHEGGFPLEQETLERLQNAYRTELYGALKAHFSIESGKNYIIARPTATTQGWAIVHHETNTSEGILYPILKGNETNYLKTTRTGTKLIYGTGASQTAYFDYISEYISPDEYAARVPQNTETLMVDYLPLQGFKTITDIASIEAILKKTADDLSKFKDAVIKDLGDTNGRIDTLDAHVRDSYLPLDGSKAMTGNLTVQGKVKFNNVDATDGGSLLLLNGSNQVVKNNTLIQSILDEIDALKKKPATAIPIGMIAIWGRPANQIPEGWQEYTPLRGRMPVGFDLTQSEFNEIEKQRGAKNKTLSLDEMPSHRHAVGPFSGTGSTGSEDWIAEPYENDPDNRRAGNLSAPEGGGQQFSILNPYSVVHFIEYTGLPNNTTKPAPPANLTVTKATSSSISLNWTKATDNAAIASYLISIDGGDYITLGNVDTYIATKLSPERSYTFKVFAQDVAGNISDGSAITKVTPPVIPVPTSLTCTIEQNEVVITWDRVASYTPIKYSLVRTIEEIPGSHATFAITDSNVRRDFFNYTKMHTHHYQVQALGEDGNESNFSNVVTKNVYPYDPACFDIESPVTMVSGQSKKLKNIVIGDKLQGFSFANEIDESAGNYFLWNGKLNEAVKAEVTVVNKKTSIQPNFYEIKTGDTILKVTGEHPLLVTEDGENLRWIKTKDIKKTMLLIDKLGKTKPIESILFKEEPLEVVLLDVEDIDNYVISGIVAHNTKVDPLE